MANTVEITLIGKPGCHLCDDARDVLSGVVSRFTNAHSSANVNVIELNILEDAALAAKYSEEIPVVLIDGKMHSYWRVDADRLLAKLGDLTGL